MVCPRLAGLLALLVCCSLVATRAAIDDDDEFASDAVGGASASSLGSKVAAAAGLDSAEDASEGGAPVGAAGASSSSGAAAPPGKALDLGPFWWKKDWTMEIIGTIAVLGYVGFALYARRQVSSDARLLESAAIPALSAQFSRLGPEGRQLSRPTLAPVTAQKRELWSSGRRGCHGALTTLSLRSNLDLTTIVKGLMPGAASQASTLTPGARAATSAEVDRLTIEVPLDEASAQACLFSCVPTKDRKAANESRPDVTSIAPCELTARELGVGLANCEYAIRTDHRDVARAILRPQSAIVELMGRHPRAILDIFVTDVDIRELKNYASDGANWTSMETVSLSPRTLSVTAELPSLRSEWATFVPDFVGAVMQIVDRLNDKQGAAGVEGGASFSSAAKDAVKRNRAAVLDRLKKEEQEEILRLAKITKEQEELKAREVKYNSLKSRSEKKKFEEEEYKDAQKRELEKAKKAQKKILKM